MASISWTSRAGASAGVALLLACGPPHGVTPGTAATANAPPPLPPRPLAEVFVLEAGGAEAEDTVVTVAPGSPRVVVLRRSGPDYGLFATLQFAGHSLSAPGAGGSVRLTIHPTPGVYGLDLAIDGAIGDSARILFSYGVHFVAPEGARQRYGSNLAFEKELAIGRLSDSGVVVFLPTLRPGSDMLSAPLPGPGRYLVAAPR